MCIRLGFYSPKEGISVEEMFNYHVQVHAPEIMQVVSRVATPGLKKYLVGRITRVADGKAPFSNYVKMWWDDEEAMNRYLEVLRVAKLPGQKPIEKGFYDRANWGFTAFVEEAVIFEKK